MVDAGPNRPSNLDPPIDLAPIDLDTGVSPDFPPVSSSLSCWPIALALSRLPDGQKQPAMLPERLVQLFVLVSGIHAVEDF